MTAGSRPEVTLKIPKGSQGMRDKLKDLRPAEPTARTGRAATQLVVLEEYSRAEARRIATTTSSHSSADRNRYLLVVGCAPPLDGQGWEAAKITEID